MNPQQKQTFLSTVVSIGASQVGVQEVPKFSNWGNLVKQYLAAVGITSPASWCMAFGVWCCLRALARLGLAQTEITLVLTGYCPTQVDHARSLGTLIAAGDVASGAAHVLAGYLMVENIPAEGGYHHTGVVTAAPDADGAFTTVEGNTNTDGGSEGYEVAYQHRNIHQKASDGSPKYAFIATC